MGIFVVTDVYPALLLQDGDFPKQKLVLISHAPAHGPASIQTQSVVFEISIPVDCAAIWMEISNYMVRRSTLDVPFFFPNGKVSLKRWICLSTSRPLGKVLWNRSDFRMRLVIPRIYLPILTFYFCHVARSNNWIGHTDLPNTSLVPSTENMLWSNETVGN